MPSLVAEIGEVLETHMRKIGLIENEELSDSHKALIEEKERRYKPWTKRLKRIISHLEQSFAQSAILRLWCF